MGRLSQILCTSQITVGLGSPLSLARVSHPACSLFAAQGAITFPTLLGGDARQCPSFNKNLEHQSGSCSCLQAPARRAPPALACSARGRRIRDLRALGLHCQLQGLRKTPKQACLGTGGKTQDGPLKHHSWWQWGLAQPFQSCNSPSGATPCEMAPQWSARSGDKRQQAGSLCTKEAGGWVRGGGSWWHRAGGTCGCVTVELHNLEPACAEAILSPRIFISGLSVSGGGE